MKVKKLYIILYNIILYYIMYKKIELTDEQKQGQKELKSAMVIFGFIIVIIIVAAILL